MVLAKFLLNGKCYLPSNYRMYLSVIIGLFLSTICGYTSVWASPMLKKLKGSSDNPLGRTLSEDEEGLLAALIIPGNVIGALLTSIATQKFGRKPILITAGVIPLVSYLMMAFLNKLPIYYLGQLLDGFVYGSVGTILFLYICEVSEPNQRGTLCSANRFFQQLGTIFTYTLGSYMSFRSYHLTMISLPLLFIILFSIWALESPYYYLQKDVDKCENILRKLRGKKDVTTELNTMKNKIENISSESDTFVGLFKTRAARRAIFITFGISTFTTLTGDIVIALYLELMFDMAGGKWSSENEAIYVAIFQTVIACVFSLTVVENFKRRTLMILSHIGVAISQTALGIFLVLKDEYSILNKYNWFPLFAFFGYVFSFNIGVGPLNGPLLGELLPPKIKDVVSSMNGIYCSVLVFAMTLLFPRFEEMVGLGTIFLIFAPSSLFAAAFYWIFLIETRGKSLEVIQSELEEV